MNNPIGDAIAWEEGNRKQGEEKLQKQQEAFQELESKRYIVLTSRIRKLEESVRDLQQIVQVLVDEANIK
jgi:hypothetical protein